MYSIPDLFMWFYASGVTPESLSVIASLVAVSIFAVVVWLNGYIAERQYANKIKRAMEIQNEIDGSGAKKAPKAGDVIKPRVSGFRFQKSND